MRHKDLTSNIIHVLFAAIVSVAIGVITGFFIPKLYTIENYALYKTFTLYLGYVGVLHFGFSDGVLLKFAGYDLNDLPKKEIRGYVRLFIFWHVLVSLLLALLVTISELNATRKICFYLVCANITIVNLNNLLSFLNQATKKFKLDSKISLLQSVLSIAIAGAVIVFDLRYFLPYLIFITCVYLTVLFVRIACNRDFIFGKSEKLKNLIPNVMGLIKVGFWIMISQLMGELILGIDRILIDNFMLQVDFAIYSFAVSLLGIFYAVLNSLSKIVYPYLARCEGGELSFYYVTLSLLVFVVAGVALNSFYVIKIVVENFLLQYSSSIKILEILYPTLLFKMMVGFIGANYFKLLKMERRFMLTNLIVFLIAAATDVLALIIFKDIYYIAMASLITFIIWFMIMHFQLSKRLAIKKINLLKILLLPIAVTIAFFACNLLEYFGIVLFNVAIVLFVVILCRSELKLLIKFKNGKSEEE